MEEERSKNIKVNHKSGKGVKSRVMKVNMILTRSVSSNVDHPHGDIWKQMDTRTQGFGSLVRITNADLRVINKKDERSNLEPTTVLCVCREATKLWNIGL